MTEIGGVLIRSLSIVIEDMERAEMLRFAQLATEKSEE